MIRLLLLALAFWLAAFFVGYGLAFLLVNPFVGFACQLC